MAQPFVAPVVSRKDRFGPEVIGPAEASALVTAVDFMNAGEADGVTKAEVEAAEKAAGKLGRAPKRAVWMPFSQQELDALWTVIQNGAEGLLQPSSGVSAVQKRAFRAAANRMADAGNIGGPRF